MTVSLDLSPLGAPGAGTAAAPLTSEYLTPDTGTVPIYVYATVTGSNALSASDINALEYLYFNVNNSFTGTATGAITAAVPNGALGFGANGVGGSQGGQVNASGSVSVGPTGTVTAANYVQYAKPRVVSSPSHGAYNIPSSTITPDGTNVIVSGNSVSFLVETLTFTPGAFNPSVPGGPINSSSFTVSVPPLNSPYVSANYFTDLSATQMATLSSGGTLNGSTQTTIGTPTHATVTLTDTMNGDTNADGIVNIGDYNTLTGNFNQPGNWSQGNFDPAGGIGTVNIGDYNELTSVFNQSIGAAPSSLIASPTAEVAGGSAAVPEPASLALLGLAGLSLVGRRRARAK
jgi:PEP-CTERM motif